MNTDDPLNSQTNRHPLENAGSADWGQLILQMVESHPDKRLILPELNNAPLNLRGLNLNHNILHEVMSASDTVPEWWHADGYAQFQKAKMNGANLQGSDFSDIDLTEADFRNVTMRQATLRKTRLEGANFQDSDLSGSDFSSCTASEADFTNALLEDVKFEGAVLRFANFKNALLDGANFQKADLWGAQMQEAEATNANFSGVVFRETCLQAAKLTDANFKEAELKNVDLSKSSLRRVDFSNASLGHVNFENADLSGASLPRVDLSTCNLKHAKFADAWLENTRFQLSQLGGAVGEEVAGDYEAARQAYLALEQNFRTIGNPEAASWAFRKGRRMGKHHSFVLMHQALSARHWKIFFSRLMEWSGDLFAEWLCDYGESLPRVLRAFVVTLICFASFYGLSSNLRYSITTGGHEIGDIVRNPLQLMSFSFFAMCNVGLPDLGFKPYNPSVYYLTSTEYIAGLILIGLFGYVLGNRLRR